LARVGLSAGPSTLRRLTAAHAASGALGFIQTRPWHEIPGIATTRTDIPLHTAVHRGVLGFNECPEDAEPPHRERMRLILKTPALQAHSVLRYAQWRAVIAEYVANRLDLRPDDLIPRTVGQVSLALALSAYETWLEQPDASLHALLESAMAALADYMGK